MDNLEVLNVQPDDYIILKFDIDKLDYGTAMETLDTVSKTFPNNKVISLPDGASLQKFSDKEMLKRWIHDVQEEIEMS